MKWFNAFAGLWWLKAAYVVGAGYQPANQWTYVLACSAVGVWLEPAVFDALDVILERTNQVADTQKRVDGHTRNV